MDWRLWFAALCAASILTLCIGLRQGFGLFLTPISVDLSLGREVFALGIALQNLLWGLAAPFAGAIADRYGSGRVVAGGALAYAGGLVLQSLATTGTEIVLSTLTIGFGLAGCGFSIVLGAVGRAAPPQHRSFALGVASTGGSFGQFAIVPFTQAVLSASDWRTTLVAMAAVALVMAPLAWGLAERGARPRPTSGAAAQSLREAMAEAFRIPGYWLLVTGFFVCGFHVAFVATHLPSFVADRALPAWVAAAALALIGLFNIFGTLACGMLGARFQKKNVLSLLYLTRAFVFMIVIVLPVTETSVLVFAALLGMLWLGTVPLTSGLVAYLFGPAYMSTLYGIVFLGHQVGSFFGAWLGGYVYDLTGSYDAVWWASAALGVAAALLHWPIVERPVPRLAQAAAR